MDKILEQSNELEKNMYNILKERLYNRTINFTKYSKTRN